MCKLDKRRDAIKSPPYVISAVDCCKRHIKGWIERNPQWEKHPTTHKMLVLKTAKV